MNIVTKFDIERPFTFRFRILLNNQYLWEQATENRKILKNCDRQFFTKRQFSGVR